MTNWIHRTMAGMAARRTAWRRARNVRRAHSQPATQLWVALAAAALVAAGAGVIVAHARQMNTWVPGAQDAAVFQGVLPGATIDVPSASGAQVSAHGGAALVVVSAMQAQAPVHMPLCGRTQASGRIAPILIGYRFADIEKLGGQGELERIALAPPDGMPRLTLTGRPGDAQLRVQVTGEGAWTADQGAKALGRDGWLTWPKGALHVQRGASASCPAGVITAQLFKPGAAPRALATAYANGVAVSAWMAPGRYAVPARRPARMEDEALFQALQARGLLRLGRSQLIELVPRDLPAWRATSAGQRTTVLDTWNDVTLDGDTGKLIERLYRAADGEYVRTQVNIFNAERRLLAWRLRGDAPASSVAVGAAPAQVAPGLPPVGARLFASVPSGWAEWSRVSSWPQSMPGPAQLTLTVPESVAGQSADHEVELMLAGHLQSLTGAQRIASSAACTGRACPSDDAVQVLRLMPTARQITLTVTPLDTGALAGSSDDRYRHLFVRDGKLGWRTLAPLAAAAKRGTAAPVTLADRHGTLLWSDGAPTAQAAAAGLATLLGVNGEHANSVAGMLARLPSQQSHHARLSIDLPLQAASQAALDCIGMRHGHWDGAHCSGTDAVPAERQAGLVLIDADTGDVLAAAGAGSARVTPANWHEVRDFDRANPARSPLRLAALQHDGGAHRSPGSTFKVVSALGLELAARHDPALARLLNGMPLADINSMARERGFAFQTTAASYPFNTDAAHITNYKDQQLDRRAQDGKLGLAQAMTYSLNTWFAWSGELSDRSLFARAEGGAPDLQPLDPSALDGVRPIVAMAHTLGFEQTIRLDGGLLPADFDWSTWDALQAGPARIDPVHTRHEVRQMAIGLRMQATPLQMALVAGAVGQGRTLAPRLLLELDGHAAGPGATAKLGVRLDRVRAGMKGVIDVGTAAGAFRGPGMDPIRRGLSGKTGTAPTSDALSTVWFTGWLEPGTLPGQTHRLAFAAFVSHSETTGGEHAAPIVAAVLRHLSAEQRGK